MSYATGFIISDVAVRSSVVFAASVLEEMRTLLILLKHGLYGVP